MPRWIKPGYLFIKHPALLHTSKIFVILLDLLLSRSRFYKKIDTGGKSTMSAAHGSRKGLTMTMTSFLCVINVILIKVGSHNPFFGSSYSSAIVSAHRNVDLRH